MDDQLGRAAQFTFRVRATSFLIAIKIALMILIIGATIAVKESITTA